MAMPCRRSWMRRARSHFKALQRTSVRAGLRRHLGFLATTKFTKNNRIPAASHSQILTITGTMIEALFRLKFRLKTLVEFFLILWLSKAKEGRKGVRAKEKTWANRALGKTHLYLNTRPLSFLQAQHLPL